MANLLHAVEVRSGPGGFRQGHCVQPAGAGCAGAARGPRTRHGTVASVLVTGGVAVAGALAVVAGHLRDAKVVGLLLGAGAVVLFGPMAGLAKIASATAAAAESRGS
jgi:hypothetical protein